MMKLFRFCAPAVIALIAAGTAQAQTNQFGDPSFEDPTKFLAAGATALPGNWYFFDGDGVASATEVTTMPRTGAAHVNLNITNQNNSFAGFFQEVSGLSGGQQVTYSGWNKNAGGVLDIAGEYRIEWRNATAELARTANFVPTLTDAYTQFSLAVPVPTTPAGITTARVVYAVQSFGDGVTNTGTVFADDFSFTVVPEPGSAVLACFGLLAFRCVRRRG